MDAPGHYNNISSYIDRQKKKRICRCAVLFLEQVNYLHTGYITDTVEPPMVDPPRKGQCMLDLPKITLTIVPIR